MPPDTATPAEGGPDRRRPGRGDRRPALIATAIALPVTVLLAFAFTAGSDHRTTPTAPEASAAVTVAAPPTPDAATQRGCLTVFEKLPVQLGSLTPRKTDTDSSYVAAWGNPPIVLRCGVAKPTALNNPNEPQPIDVSGVLWQPAPQKSDVVFTAVDRSVYVEVTVPSAQTQPLTDLAPAIKALPQVCTGYDATGQTTNATLPACG